MAEYRIARLEEIDEVNDGRCPFRPVRQKLGVTGFGINTWSARSAGDRLINEHAEEEPDAGEEVYFVASGRARFELDGRTEEAPTGTFVAVPPSVRRTAFAEEDGTTVLAIGGAAPGKPYEPSGWELFAPLLGLFESGDYEEGADRAQALIADDPPYGAVYYNTACFESRAGRTEQALAHLRRAIELSAYLAELAREDEDLAAIRNEPAFAAIIAT